VINRVPDRKERYRGDEYRRRAEEARQRAKSAMDEKDAASCLQIAETWERMAKWEDRIIRQPRK
jgi:hypothetical protein